MGKIAALLIQEDDIVRKARTSKAAKQPINSSTRNMSLKKISPLNEAQRQMMDAFYQGSHIWAEGSAGTGKSYIACYLALTKLMNKEVSSIKLIRSAVPTRDVGFLPGSLDEKNAVYEAPYEDIVNDLFSCGTAYDILKKKGSIEFQTTSYLRGLTFKDCVIIVDEGQSQTFHETFTVLSRVGANCQVILCGDNRQCDLTKKGDGSGFADMRKVVSRMPKWFDIVSFTPEDIVRSAFVKALITESEEI